MIPMWLAGWSVFCFLAGAMAVILAAIVSTSAEDNDRW
jgi:hypothetical protein